MNNEETENSPHTPTEFGKLLRVERILMGEKNAENMAKALGISASQLSEIENGNKKEYPDIDFLIRCMDYFGWRIHDNDDINIKRKKIEKTLGLFEKGFLSSEIISLNMKYFHAKRKDILAQILVLLLFMPDKMRNLQNQTIFDDDIKNFNEAISFHYESFKAKITKENITGFLKINDLGIPPPPKKITRNRKK